MEDLVPGSISALSQAFTWELERARLNPLHGQFDISCKLDSLSNGIKRCSVQVRCKAQCGWLVQTFGPEAKALEKKVRDIQLTLKERSIEQDEMLEVLFPECLVEGQCVTQSSEKHHH